MKRRRPNLRSGFTGQFTSTTFEPVDAWKALNLTVLCEQCVQPPPLAYRWGQLRNGVWYLHHEGQTTRAINLIYEHLYGPVNKLYRQCKTHNCLNPNHYINGGSMQLTSYQATRIWLDLIENPRVLEIPGDSGQDYQNNRNRMNKARTKLMNENPAMLTLNRFEVSKILFTTMTHPKEHYIVIRPTHVGTADEDADLMALGINPKALPQDPFVNTTATAPVKMNEIPENAGEEMSSLLRDIGYGISGTPADTDDTGDDEKKT